jgi:UDP-GlcNAc:undecaprenyl-phosphate GlcNAc-1-phosphate transferase
VLYLYAWTILLGGLAVALRFVPYSDHHGHFHTGWTVAVVGFGVLVIAASVYLVYVLEILKFKRLDTMRLRRVGATEAEIDEDVQRRLETGEFEQVRRETEEFDAVRE